MWVVMPKRGFHVVAPSSCSLTSLAISSEGVTTRGRGLARPQRQGFSGLVRAGCQKVILVIKGHHPCCLLKESQGWKEVVCLGYVPSSHLSV